MRLVAWAAGDDELAVLEGVVAENSVGGPAVADPEEIAVVGGHVAKDVCGYQLAYRADCGGGRRAVVLEVPLKPAEEAEEHIVWPLVLGMPFEDGSLEVL